MFFSGETIIHTFVVPFNIIDVDHIVVSYKQKDDIIFEKVVASGFKEEGEGLTSFSFDMDQEDSLLFEDSCNYYFQINVYTKGGSRHTSYRLPGKSMVQYFREVMNDG